MKSELGFSRLLLVVLFLGLATTAVASTTWYVDGVNGSDSNNCMSATTACQTIGHAISLASSGDSIMVAPATYTENLTISINLKILGANASTTIVDGGGKGTVVTISRAGVTLSELTIRNGSAYYGGGIRNAGKLVINDSTISGNSATDFGGGIYTVDGTQTTLNNTTISGNTAKEGGGIANKGTLTINRSTISANESHSCSRKLCIGFGGGVINFGQGTLTLNNSTLSGNTSVSGGGIFNYGTVTINNSTISGNSAAVGAIVGGSVILQNSIVANSSGGPNCFGTMTSNGYNLSSDNSCNFNGPGDLNNTDPMLGSLASNGGPTQTMALLPGSPAIDAGNPNGCTDGKGNLLKTDQRGFPRPDKEDTSGCDMGAFERQTD